MQPTVVEARVLALLHLNHQVVANELGPHVRRVPAAYRLARCIDAATRKRVVAVCSIDYDERDRATVHEWQKLNHDGE